MSLYDDLADSGYLGKDKFRNQLQSNSQLNNRGQHLSNAYDTSDSGKVNQDENFSQFGIVDGYNVKDDFTNSGKTQNDDMRHLAINSNLDNSAFLLQSQLPKDTKLAKEDLFSKRHVIGDDFDDDHQYQQQKRVLDDAEIVQVNPVANNPYYFSRPTEHRPANGAKRQPLATLAQQTPMEIDQYRNNNDQLQQILMQLQNPRGQQRDNSQLLNQNNKVSNYQDSEIQQPSYSRGSMGPPTHQKLNKDNSILEIAKMQNSNGSNSDTYQMHSVIGKDYLQTNFLHSKGVEADQSGVNNTNYPLSTAYEYLNPPSILMNSGLQYSGIQSNYHPQMMIGHNRQVSDVDKENYNLFQIRPQQQLKNQQPVYQQQPQIMIQQHAKTQRDPEMYQQKYINAPQQQQPVILTGLSKTNFFSRGDQATDQELKRKELMDKFDDIPIKELNKAEGYQQQNNPDFIQEEDNEELSLNIFQKIEHSKWKVRMKAYKEISEQFYLQYTQDQNNKKFNANFLNDENEEQQQQNPFDQFMPFLQKIISDQNLVAQFEGLNCLSAYVRFAPDIKQVIFMSHAILLEKIQHNKPNLREITMKILITMIRRDKFQSLLPELLRRFKNKNIKIGCFSMEVVVDSLRNNLLNDENSLRSFFKGVQDLVGHNNKELKDVAIDILIEIYKLCNDDPSAFIRNLKSLRPIQLKEVKDLLQEIVKNKVPNLVNLFAKEQQDAGNKEGLTPKKSKSVKALQVEEQVTSNRENAIDNDEDVVQDNSVNIIEVDLSSIIPDNFSEIPYITQINAKKKVMETFNNELERLVTKKSPVANKDYNLIFNVVTHMLEDSNALVYMEAIKTVEYISILMGKAIKQQKMRQFVSLLADKYKETKTASVQAVNKALQTLIMRQCIPYPQLVEFLICQLAFNNKNPRVKQLIIEKVDQTFNEEQLKDEDLISLFKVIKDKVINFIQKDTNAGVRDAAVQLLTSFKTLLFDNMMVIETVNSLPKYRVTEINKEATERYKILFPIAQSNPVGNSSQLDRPIRPLSAAPKKDIFVTLRKVQASTISELDASVLQQQIDECLEVLGEAGVHNSKQAIVGAVYSVIFQQKINFMLNINVLEVLIILLKQIFCLENSIVRDTVTGQSRDLDQAIEIALFGSTFLDNKKQPEALLNVLLSATSNTNEFFGSLLKCVQQFAQYDSNVYLLEFVFKWAISKFDYLIQRGVTVNDFEDLRSAGVQFINDHTDPEVKNQIVQAIIQFKNEIKAKTASDVTEKTNAVNQSAADQNFSFNQVLESKQNLEVLNKTLGQAIVETLDSDFEKGLMMIKQSVENIQLYDFQSKELVFNKLLTIVTNPHKNPAQQYHQAYALKALLWMREEIYGIEDSFKFTVAIMLSLGRAELAERDHSVELYLLNYWIRDFSLRDLIDRIAFSSVTDEKVFLVLFKWLMTSRINNNPDEKWGIEDFRKLALLLSKNLISDSVTDFFSQSVDKFGITKVRDFMEIQLMHNQNEYNIFTHWFQLKFRCGPSDYEAPAVADQSKQVPLLKIEETKGKGGRFDDQELRDALQSPMLPQAQSVQSTARPTGSANQQQQMDHSKLYKQLREQRKFTNQKKHSDGTDVIVPSTSDINNDQKYDQIINRLEAQLQIKHKESLDQGEPSYQTFSHQEEESIRPKTRSTSKGEHNNRYSSVTMAEEQQERHNMRTPASIHHNDDQMAMGDTKRRLQESTLKETHYRQQLQALEDEKRRIDHEKQNLLKEKNKETAEWENRYQQILRDHEEVVTNLKDANRTYQQQVGENEELKAQLKIMQAQHQQMMEKFAEFEQRLQNAHKSEKDDNKQITKMQVINDERLQIISNTFSITNGEQAEVTVQKVQELLLNFRDAKKVTEEEIGEPLQLYYQSMKTQEHKLALIKALHKSLDVSEDVLFALPFPSYKALLDFNLKIFAHEKAKLEDRSIRGSSAHGTKPQASEQNEITIEVQKIVSKLLNSKEFTTSLVTLFEILRGIMPEDLGVDLNANQKQHLKVILRCISRIQKALPTEHPDLIRSFDVLLEMQKIFMRNPPESLREDLPCLEDFDMVYRGLKEVADKMMELQPEKVKAFLNFVAQSTEKKKNENAFIKYMRQVMGMNTQPATQQENEYDEDYDY